MTDEYTMTVEVAGEECEVTLSRPQGFDFLHAAATMPDEIQEMDEGENPTLNPDVIDWLQTLVERTTDLSPKELRRVSVRDTNRLIEASAKVFAGEEPTTSTDNFRVDKPEDPFEDLDLDDDGSVDPDDWR